MKAVAFVLFLSSRRAHGLHNAQVRQLSGCTHLHPSSRFVPLPASRLFHASLVPSKKRNILSDPLPVPRVKEIDVKVVLLDENNHDLGMMKKIEAVVAARNRSLRLINVAEYPLLQAELGRRSMHPVYKLVSGGDLHKMQMEEHEKRKSEKSVHQKVLQLTSSATDHDIMTKIKHGENWLKKGDEVRVLILGRPDLVIRMNEIHKMVLAELKAFYKPNIPDLSKTDRNIKFRLVPVASAEEALPPPEKSSEG